jgi:hypothetical protein
LHASIFSRGRRAALLTPVSTLQQQSRWSCQPNGSCFSCSSSCCSKTVVEVLVMTTIQVDIASEYGMMFLYDSKVRPTFPTEAGTSPVSWTSTCLAFSVLIYVDGNAKIRLCDSPGDQSFTERFRGIIECPSKAISLCDHNGFAYASVPLTETHARVLLRASADRNPDIVECVVQNMQQY